MIKLKSNQYEVDSKTYVEKMKHLQEYFISVIQSEKGTHSRSYLKDRGYGKEEVSYYGIGFIDSDLASLSKYLSSAVFQVFLALQFSVFCPYGNSSPSSKRFFF